MDAAQAGARPQAGIGRYIRALIVAFAADVALLAVASIFLGMAFLAFSGMGLWVWLASAAVILPGGSWVGTRVAKLRGLVPYLVILVLNAGLSFLGLGIVLALFAG